MRDGIGRRRIGHEGDIEAEIGRDPGRRLATLLCPDATNDQLTDTTAGEAYDKRRVRIKPKTQPCV